jgi:hypothetical protein
MEHELDRRLLKAATPAQSYVNRFKQVSSAWFRV